LLPAVAVAPLELEVPDTDVPVLTLEVPSAETVVVFWVTVVPPPVVFVEFEVVVVEFPSIIAWGALALGLEVPVEVVPATGADGAFPAVVIGAGVTLP
jgi:hypothetical protein